MIPFSEQATNDKLQLGGAYRYHLHLVGSLGKGVGNSKSDLDLVFVPSFPPAPAPDVAAAAR